MRRTIITTLGTISLLMATQPSPAGAETREVLLAAYTVPKEVYEKRIIPSLEQQWKQKTGETIRIRSSFAASGAQARAVVGGLDADIAALSLESDLQQLVKAGLVTHDWKQGAHKGIVSTSVVALGVRQGNPKALKAGRISQNQESKSSTPVLKRQAERCGTSSQSTERA
jgi:sulfate transport system substrate-binding protein